MEEKSLEGVGSLGDGEGGVSSLAQLAREVELMSTTEQLAIAFFFRPWLPHSMFSKSIVEKVHDSGKLSGFAKFFIINADKERQGCAKLGVGSCPSLMLFWAGKPITLRRSGWDDSLQLVGPFTEENLVSIARFARETALHLSGDVLACDF